MAKVHLLAALLTIAVLAGFLSTANGQGGGRPYPPREQNRDCRYVCYYDHCSGNRCYYTCSRHRLCEEQGNVLLEAQQVNVGGAGVTSGASDDSPKLLIAPGTEVEIPKPDPKDTTT